MGSASEAPFGRRAFHPIYEACVRHSLPLALHMGGEGAASRRPRRRSAIRPYFEWYGSLPQSYMAHIMSMVTEGVFELFPRSKSCCTTAGCSGCRTSCGASTRTGKRSAPRHRGSRNRAVAISSTTSIRRRTRSKRARGPAYLHQVLDMIEAERTLMFSSSYPNWELGDPWDMIRDVPSALRQRVMVDNARAVYGARLG